MNDTRISRRGLIQAGIGAVTARLASASGLVVAEIAKAREPRNAHLSPSDPPDTSPPAKRPLEYANVLFGTASLAGGPTPIAWKRWGRKRLRFPGPTSRQRSNAGKSTAS